MRNGKRGHTITFELELPILPMPLAEFTEHCKSMCTLRAMGMNVENAEKEKIASKDREIAELRERLALLEFKSDA